MHFPSGFLSEVSTLKNELLKLGGFFPHMDFVPFCAQSAGEVQLHSRDRVTTTSLLPCSAACCWWRSPVHWGSTCTPLVGFSASTVFGLAKRLLPQVNPSSPSCKKKNFFCLCYTKIVCNEKRSTTNKECIFLQPLISN